MNILIVGLGSIARKHINAIRDICPDANLFALRSGHSASSVENVTDINSLEQVADINFDFAIISNPTALHAQTISCLLKFRIPLFIEKPIFGSLASRHLLDEIRVADIPTYVACNLRFLGCIRFIHDFIADSNARVNEVNVYCGSYLPHWRPGSDYRRSYSAVEALGGGVNIDLIHEIDYTCWIFGFPEKSFGICRSVSTLDIDAVDFASYSLIYPRFTASVILNYYRRPPRRSIDIVLDGYTLNVDLLTNSVTDSSGQILFRGDDTIADTYKSQMKFFIDTIAAGRRFENDADAAFKTLEICLAYERP